ncbi:PH domain-containing protein [Halomonas sp. ANAO-440]|uniref:PH domain-containing protein n=1 Tax=Halomonas sp. ANAO-440 TaxID=2861360 RepID=UPI001CAA4CAD|nr:PH domain-containing protein [Halomonas sp. ANAO-440]MBZ0331185.1 PH domain-containing protein [Halomonas sp. ANAO-440]
MSPVQPSPSERLVSGWQRLSPWAVGLLLISAGASLVRQHMPLLLGAGAGLAMVEQVGLRELALGGMLLLLVAGMLSLLYYRRFRFRLEGDVLIVQKGLFEHREFKVAARHVQHIALHQPAYMRPFGLVLWEVETLAGEASSIQLPGIRRGVAQALGHGLRGLKWDIKEPVAADSDRGQAGGREAVLRFAITPGALILHGLTSRSIYVIAAMLSPLIRPLERWIHDRLPQLDLQAWLPESTLLAIGLGVLGLMAMLALLAVLAAWWRFHGYALLDDGERQVQVSGLFSRQEQALSLSRLQVVEWAQTGLGRLLGRGYLVCHQFGAMSGGGAAESRRFLVPGLTTEQGRELTTVLWPGLSLDQPLARVDVIYRRVIFLRLLLGSSLLLLIVLGAVGPGGLHPAAWGVGAAALMVASAGVAQLRWMAMGWAQEEGHMRIRQGLWGQRTSIFPLQNLISVVIQQNWLQRRRGVASLQLDLANGRLRLPYLPERVAWELANRLLASVESDQVA